MRGLLDVNVLIALLDADHSLYTRAAAWFDDNARSGWASCPLTQNGCIRVMSHPGYPNCLPVQAVAERLREATAKRSTSSGLMTSACWIPGSPIQSAFTGRAHSPTCTCWRSPFAATDALSLLMNRFHPRLWLALKRTIS